MADDNEGGGWLLPIIGIVGIGLWYWWKVKKGDFNFDFGKAGKGTGGSGPLPIPGNPTLSLGINTGKTAVQLKNEFNLIKATGKVPPSVAVTERDMVQWQKDLEKAVFDDAYKRTFMSTGNLAAANGAGVAAVAEMNTTLSKVGFTLTNRN